MSRGKQQHFVGVTLGQPTMDTVGAGAKPGFRAICTCGWRGDSMIDATRAQDAALSHQAGTEVQRSIIRRTSWREAGRTWRGGWARVR
jgi:hypothetical protein